jgi:hypothetical protein
MDIENAEADEVVEVEIKPINQIQIVDSTNDNLPAYIVTMVKGKDIWLLGDRNGKVWRLSIDTL